MIDDIANYLEANTNLKKGKDLFLGNAPTSPGDCVVLYDTGGQNPYQEVPVDRPSIQVLCRSKSDKGGRLRVKNQSQEIFDLLNRKLELTIGTKDVMFARAVSSPQCLGVNDQGRWEYVTNFIFQIRNS